MADRPLWERQPWDTPASWEKFHTYYLAQAPPRSLNEAYRRYRTEQGQTQASPGAPEAPGSWRRWYRAQDGHGQPIPGAAPWNERAQAWDDHLAAQDRQRWDARRRDVRERDWDAGDALRDLAAQMLDQTPQFLKTTRRLVRGANGEPDREIITVALTADTLLRALKLASDLQRQAAEVLPPVQRHEVGGAPDGEGIPISFIRVIAHEADDDDADHPDAN